jgi:hypothetical protein
LRLTPLAPERRKPRRFGTSAGLSRGQTGNRCASEVRPHGRILGACHSPCTGVRRFWSGYSFCRLVPLLAKNPRLPVQAQPLERDPHEAALRSLMAATRCGGTGIPERSSRTVASDRIGPLRPTDRPTACSREGPSFAPARLGETFPKIPPSLPPACTRGDKSPRFWASKRKFLNRLFGKRSASVPLCRTNEPEGLSTALGCGQVGYAHKPQRWCNGAEGVFGP